MYFVYLFQYTESFIYAPEKKRNIYLQRHYVFSFLIYMCMYENIYIYVYIFRVWLSAEGALTKNKSLI